MIKKLTKTNISLLIFALCAILLCGLFAINNFASKKPSAMAYQEGSSATLKTNWKSVLEHNITNITITNKTDLLIGENGTNIGDGVNIVKQYGVSDDGSENPLTAYVVYTEDTNYDCIIYADVQTIYAPVDSSYLFSGENAYLESTLKQINFDCFNTSKTTNMYGIFRICHALTSVNVECFETKNVENMMQMFYECYKLDNINVSNFDTRSCSNFSAMFYACKALSSIDVSNFVLHLVDSVNLSGMFTSCLNVSNLILLQKTVSLSDIGECVTWNTEKVTDMSTMFGGCENITNLDLSFFDTTNVTTMEMMFGGCRRLSKLNISNFDLTNVSVTDFFGANEQSESEIKTMFGTPEDMTLYEHFDLLVAENSAMAPYTIYYRFYIPTTSITEINTPKIMGEKTINLPFSNELFINGQGETPEIELSNLNQNMLLKSKSINSETPTTGFVDEQLLPALAIGLVSIVAVMFVWSSNKKQKRI